MKIDVSCKPVIPFLGIYPKELKSMFDKVTLKAYIYSSNCNSKDVETIQVPFKRGMRKETMLHLLHEILFSHLKESNSAMNNKVAQT